MRPIRMRTGTRVRPIYLSLPNAELAVACVLIHVSPKALDSSGSDWLSLDAGWRNFNSNYKLLVNAWALYDNSQRQPVLIEECVNE